MDAVENWFTLGVRRLLPSPQLDVDVHEVYRDLGRIRPSHRPWVEICMVTSVDGSTAVDGRSGALGSSTDSQVLRELRAHADLVIVGSTTAHTERYGAPSKPGQRVGVVTRSGAVDPSLELFRSGAGFLITTEHAATHGIDAVRAGVDTVDLRSALEQLDVDVVHAEGGPLLNAALLDADVVDELNVTISPTVVGGSARRLIDGGTEAIRRFTLAHLYEDEGFLFARYVR